MNLSLWLGFLAATIVVAVSPGPGAALSMSSGLRHGYAGALRAILGLQCAVLLQLSVVVAGLGAVLAASANAFLACKLAGAAYLVWLGIAKWRSPVEAIEVGAPPPAGRLFVQGLLVNLTNPKAIVFMAALVPQFVDPATSPLLQFVILGSTMVGVDVSVMSGYALLAARCRRLFSDRDALRLQNRIFGGIFVAAGALLAGSSRT